MLLILAGIVSLSMLVMGMTTLDAQNGEVEYFDAWLPPWFLLCEMMLFTSTATVSIVGGSLALSGRSANWATIGGICSLIGFGFILGIPGLILVIRSHRGFSSEEAALGSKHLPA